MIFRRLLTLSLLCFAAAAQAASVQKLNYRVIPGPFKPTPLNVRLFWGGAIQQLHSQLKAKNQLSLATPQALRVFEAARLGSNIPFYDSLPQKYQTKPWLFLKLDVKRKTEILNKGAAAAVDRVAQELGSTPSTQAEAVPAGPAVRSWHPVLERSKPAVEKVLFAKTITAEQQAFLQESLRRRKVPWYDGLAKVGVNMKAAAAPTLMVREVQPKGTAGDLSFIMEWEQGKTQIGAFRAVVHKDDFQPELFRASLPPPPIEDQITLRFRQGVSEKDAALFLEKQNLRFISKSWQGDYLVAATGRQEAALSARRLSRMGSVLYASGKGAAFGQARRARLVFKKDGMTEAAVAGIFKKFDLTVLEDGRDGSYVVGTPKSFSSEKLMAEAAVFYAAPLASGVPEKKQLILRLKAEPRDLKFLSKMGFRLLGQLNSRSFLVSARKRTGAQNVVESLVSVGALSEEKVDAAINSLREASQGYRVSGSQFNEDNMYSRQALVLAGATGAQLKRFDLAAEESSSRGEFKSYSGG